MRRDELQLERARPLLELLHALQVVGVAARDELHVVERGHGGGERHAVHVEGLAHAVHHVGDRRMRERVADPQARQPIGLRERTRDHEVGMALEPLQAVGPHIGRQVLVVGLVEHHQHPLRHPAQEGFHLGAACQGPGRVVRVRHPGDVGLVVDRFRHRLEVVAVVLRRHHDRTGAARLSGERVDGERMLRIHRRAPRPEERKRDQLQGVVRAVAEHDRRRVHAVALGQRRFQLEAVAVGVARHLADCRLDGGAGARADAARVLV